MFLPGRDRRKKKRGLVFVLSAPSGTGKTTLCKRLIASGLDFKKSVSVTTRKPRRGEVNGRDYIFMTSGEFKSLEKKGGFLEWARVFDNFYGTPRCYIEKVCRQGKNILLILDVQGAMQVKEKIPDAVLIFLLPPSWEDLKKRLRKRHADKSQEIEQRLKIARKEIAYLKRYDYAVVNDQIGKATAGLKSILSAERLRVRPFL